MIYAFRFRGGGSTFPGMRCTILSHTNPSTIMNKDYSTRNVCCYTLFVFVTSIGICACALYQQNVIHIVISIR